MLCVRRPEENRDGTARWRRRPPHSPGSPCGLRRTSTSFESAAVPDGTERACARSPSDPWSSNHVYFCWAFLPSFEERGRRRCRPFHSPRYVQKERKEEVSFRMQTRCERG